MSRFLATLLDSARTMYRGMTTGEPHAPVRRPWTDVHGQAVRIAGALREAGVGHGSAVGVLAGDPAAIAPLAQAVWLVGGSVTMLHQPTTRTDLASWAADTVRVLRMIDASLVVLGAPFGALGGVLDQHGIRYRTTASLSGWDGAPGAVSPDAAAEDDTALLQLTSGSTAEPKAVRITHRNLQANITAMRQAARLDVERDVMVSWLPLFHDMGMVGFLTVPMVTGLELVSVTPQDFLARPLLWAELISRHGGTVTAAPNFAYAVLARQLARAETELDLSSLRIALNGAEPVDPAAVDAFTRAGARFGLRPESVLCAYGMAETALGVSFAPVETGIAVDEIDADALEAGRRAVPVEARAAADADRDIGAADADRDTGAAADADPAAEAAGAGEAADRPAVNRANPPGVRRFPLLGPPLPGIEVRVVGPDGVVLGPREVGALQLRGESVTPEYLTVDGPRPTQDEAGWFDTGDEGYLVEDGQVVVCGRRKDVIIMGGRNIYPTDIERAAGEVDGVRAGNAVAVRLTAGEGRHRESFAVVVEARGAGAADEIIRKDVISRVVSAVGVRPAQVTVVKPGMLPKTPSGKLRRAATAALVGG